MAYYGPPEEGLKYFGLTRWAEVFQAFERYPDRDWAAEYAASPAHAQYVLSQRPKPPAQANDLELPAAPPPQRRGALRQTSTPTRRYMRVIAADRGYHATHWAATSHPGRADPFGGIVAAPSQEPSQQPERQHNAVGARRLRLLCRGRQFGQGIG